MAVLLLRRIPQENERCVRDFFRDARDFGPDDVDRFLSSVDGYASRRGKIANFEKSYSNTAITLELWMESDGGPADTISRVFRIQRLGKELKRGKNSYLVGTGPFYLSREMSQNIPANAVKVTPAIMNSEVGTLAEMLRSLRIFLTTKDPERAREAKYDLEQACKGSRVGYVDLFNGHRVDIF